MSLESQIPGQMSFKNVPSVLDSVKLVFASKDQQESLAEVDLNKKIAFGGTTNLKFYGLKKEILDGYENADSALVDHRLVIKSLYPERKEGLFVVGDIALNETEYDLFPRNIESLGKAAMAKTLRKRLDSNKDSRYAAADRSRMHTYDSKGERLAKMIAGLENEKKELEWLGDKIKSPGYALTTEAVMRQTASSVLVLCFGNILGVVGNEQSWDAATRNQAERALLVSLFTGAQRQKVANWAGWTKFAKNYTISKRNLARNRLRTLERRADDIRQSQNPDN